MKLPLNWKTKAIKKLDKPTITKKETREKGKRG
jgi:hypothetical protein